MKNKVLVKIISPELDKTYDVFIPVNEMVWRIKKLIVKAISDLANTNFQENLEFILINKENGRVYNNNEIIIDTDIRNATELIFFSKR